VLLARESPQHQLDHADLHLGLARLRRSLVIPAVDPATPQPCKCPLHHPTPSDHPEPLGPRGAAADLDRIPTVLGDPGIQRVVAVLVVRPQLGQPGERPLGQLLKHSRGGRPVVRRGTRDRHRQDQPERIHDEMPLAAVESLAAVIAVRAADLGRLDGLAVDTPGRGRRVSARPAADLAPEDAIEGRPGPVVPPLDEVVVDRPPLGEVVRQGPPGTAVAVAVEDGVEDPA